MPIQRKMTEKEKTKAREKREKLRNKIAQKNKLLEDQLNETIADFLSSIEFVKIDEKSVTQALLNGERIKIQDFDSDFFIDRNGEKKEKEVKSNFEHYSFGDYEGHMEYTLGNRRQIHGVRDRYGRIFIIIDNNEYFSEDLVHKEISCSCNKFEDYYNSLKDVESDRDYILCKPCEHIDFYLEWRIKSHIKKCNVIYNADFVGMIDKFKNDNPKD